MFKKLALYLVFVLNFVGCASESEVGTATVAFANATGARAQSLIRFFEAPRYTSETPTTFKMKLIAAYAAEDIDPDTGNNVGATAIIYMNPDCNDDIMHCDISAGTAEDGAAFSNIVTSYFDFAQSSADVNTELNAQGREITVGTFKYARLEFCKYNSADDENITWGSTSSAGPNEFQRNSCTVNSVELDPPAVLAAGGTLTITLSYDLTNTVRVGADATGDGCTGSGASKACFTLPTFTPTAE